MIKAFISYAGDDTARAHELASALRRNDVDPWMFEENRVAGEFDLRLKAALRDAQAVVVIVTPSILESRWVRSEISAAFRANKIVLPVVVERIDQADHRYPTLLSGLQWFETQDLTRDAHLIADMLNGAIAAPRPDKQHSATLHSIWYSERTRILDAIRTAPVGSDLRIVQTWIPNSEDFLPKLEAALVDNPNVTQLGVLLSRPGIGSENTAVALRARYREDLLHPREFQAREYVIQSLHSLLHVVHRVNTARRRSGHIAELTSSFRLYDGMSFGPVFRVGMDRMFVGTYLCHTSSDNGPMIEISQSSGAWGEINRHTEQVWSHSEEVSPRFMTESLWATPKGPLLSRAMQAAIDNVHAGRSVKRRIQLRGEELVIDTTQRWSFNDLDGVILVAVGKAAYSMAAAADEILGRRIRKGIVLTKDGMAQGATLSPSIIVLEGGHPYPDQRNIEATRLVIDMVSSCGKRDLVLLMLSGGGSSLLTLPIQGVTLDDLRWATLHLQTSGANIYQLNAIRSRLDSVKSGGLAAVASHTNMTALVVSDVVGDDFATISSGPAYVSSGLDESSETTAKTVQRFELLSPSVPVGVRKALQIKSNPREFSMRVPHTLIARNEDAVAACRKALLELDCDAAVHVLSTQLTGEARDMGKLLASVLVGTASTGRIPPESGFPGSPQPLRRPFYLLAGGETQVTVASNPGNGGRNQELALAAVELLDGQKDMYLISLATDGDDGPKGGAAGAVATGNSMQRARLKSLFPADYLSRSDSNAFFRQLNDVLVPGPTGTNVNDIVILAAL